VICGSRPHLFATVTDSSAALQPTAPIKIDNIKAVYASLPRYGMVAAAIRLCELDTRGAAPLRLISDHPPSSPVVSRGLIIPVDNAPRPSDDHKRAQKQEQVIEDVVAPSVADFNSESTGRSYVKHHHTRTNATVSPQRSPKDPTTSLPPLLRLRSRCSAISPF
jgi:hypothetical protein